MAWLGAMSSYKSHTGEAPAVFTESRLLPAMCAGVALVTALAVWLSAERLLIRALLVGAFLLAGCYATYRSLHPRWVVRVEKNKLRFNNLYERKIVEVDLATVVSAQIQETEHWVVGLGEGLGFQNWLVLQTKDQSLRLPLPFLAGRPDRVLLAVRDALSVKRHD